MAKNYIFTGKLELRGVQFFVTAENEAEARQRAKDGHWDDYDTGGADSINWHIDASSIELND